GDGPGPPHRAARRACHPPPPHRVGPAAHLRHPGGAHAHPPPAVQRRLGAHVRRSAAVPARPRRQPAAQDRARPASPGGHPHRARSGLPARDAGLMREAGRRSWRSGRLGRSLRNGRLGRPGSWLFWSATLLAVTMALVSVRGDLGDLGQAHVTLIYLLVVLGGSASGGRALGFTLACACFLLIDYFLQTPYDMLSVEKPLDRLGAVGLPGP